MRAMRIWISAVGVSCGDALPEGFEAVHLCLDATSDMVSGPVFPECPAIVAGGAQGLVPGRCRRAILLPKSAVLADRKDQCSLSGDDGGVAKAGKLQSVVSIHRL